MQIPYHLHPALSYSLNQVRYLDEIRKCEPFRKCEPYPNRERDLNKEHRYVRTVTLLAAFRSGTMICSSRAMFAAFRSGTMTFMF